MYCCEFDEGFRNCEWVCCVDDEMCVCLMYCLSGVYKLISKFRSRVEVE